MKNSIIKFALAFVFSLSLSQTTSSQQNSSSQLEWRPELQKLGNYKSSFLVTLTAENKMKMETLWNEIGEDLKTERNQFAGTYAETGYGSGYFLRWSTGKGFILIPYFDQNLIADFSYGNVKITADSEVIFAPQKEMRENGGRSETPRIWIPVKDAEFLVYKEQIASFGDYYGGFGEFNGFPRKRMCDECGTFARRVDDKKIVVNASFLAPLKYLKFIRKPISGQIMRVGKRRKTKNIITSCCGFETDVSARQVLINVGRKQGVTRDLLFLLVDAGDSFNQILKITRVGEKTSEGIVFRVLDKNGKENYDGKIYDRKSESYNQIPFPPLGIGTRITTSPIVQ